MFSFFQLHHLHPFTHTTVLVFCVMSFVFFSLHLLRQKCLLTFTTPPFLFCLLACFFFCTRKFQVGVTASPFFPQTTGFVARYNRPRCHRTHQLHLKRSWWTLCDGGISRMFCTTHSSNSRSSSSRKTQQADHTRQGGPGCRRCRHDHQPQVHTTQNPSRVTTT